MLLIIPMIFLRFSFWCIVLQVLKMQTLRELFFITKRKILITTLGLYFDVRRYSTRAFCRDSYDFLQLLKQCKSTKSIGKLHAQMIFSCHDQNPFVASKLIGKYIEFGDTGIEVARKVFDKLPDRDVLLWNMVIRGYANLGPCIEALKMYRRMRLDGLSVNEYTYPFVLKACAAMRDRKNGRVVHGHAIKSGLDLDLFVGNALIAFYSKSRDVEAFRRVFDEMPRKDIISWNSMIAGYAANGYTNEALVIFCTVVRDHTTCFPDHATLVSTLTACVQTSAIRVGLWIHSYIIKSGMEVDGALGSALISMYANCGQVSIAREVFVRCGDKNLEMWSAMIRCYGMNGLANESFHTFSEMLDFGVYPDGVTFLCLLSACSHAGMVEKGCQLFEEMEDLGVEKNEKHYACMVDLLVRAGFIEHAIEFIKTMPMQPGKDVYSALLSACKTHGNIELAEEVAEKLVSLDPDSARRYLTLANTYEEKGRWEDAARIRKELGDKKIRKLSGVSSIQVN